MIDRFALSFLCIELDRNVRTGVTGLYILLTHVVKYVQKTIPLIGIRITPLHSFRQTRLSRARLTREPQYAPCSQHGQRPVYVEAVLGDTEDISFEIIGRGNRKSSSDKYGVAIPVTAHARYPGQYPATELVLLSRDNNSYERPNFTRIDACESSLCKTAAIPCYYEAGRAIPDIVADNVVESGV